MTTMLVTGGAGFIGSHLTDVLLHQGYKVRVIDNLSTGKRSNLDPRAELIVGDVANAELLRLAMRGCAGAFHLAAVASVQRSNEDWVGTHRANQTGTIAVLDAARDASGLPVVYASSAAIYGDQGEAAVREDARPDPLTAYGADKLASELHAAVAWKVHRVPTLGFRFFNVYGPRQDPASPYSGVISIFANRAWLGQGVMIHGDGMQSRDFVHVKDVVRGLLAGMQSLLQRPRADVLNLCTGRASTLLDLIAALESIVGEPVPVTYGPARRGDIRVSLGDSARLAATLGVTADTRLEGGLRGLLDSLSSPSKPSHAFFERRSSVREAPLPRLLMPAG